MIHGFWRPLAVILLLLTGVLWGPTGRAAAAEKADGAAFVSPKVYKRLKHVEDLMARNAYDEGIGVLDRLLPEVAPESYEEAAVLRALASLHALRGDYRRAADLLAKSLATKTLPAEQERASLFNLAQLYMASGAYRMASDILEPWLRQAAPRDDEAYMLLANAYAQQKRYRETVEPLRKALSRSNEPKESLYRLLLAMNYELHDYDACANVLLEMIRRFPDNPEYWQQLSAIYLQSKQYGRALAIKRLAYRQGHVQGDRAILELVDLFVYAGAPYQGAALLLEAIDAGRVPASAENWERLADAWTAAKEHARSADALKKAAALIDSGEVYLRLGRVYLEQENWGQAKAALEHALAKGGLKEPGQGHLLLGISLQGLGKRQEAERAFTQAQGFAHSRESARQWLSYVTSRSP